MKFVRIKLDLTCSEVRRSLADVQILHRNIQKFFNSSRSDAKVLFRRNRDTVYLTACREPDRTEIEGMKVVSVTDTPDFSEGQICHFNILTQAYRKHGSERYPLVQEEDQMEWLYRQAEKGGFEILSVINNGNEVIKSNIKSVGDKPFYIKAFHYMGMLRVTDKAKFGDIIENGIGASKAYGLGMLLVI